MTFIKSREFWGWSSAFCCHKNGTQRNTVKEVVELQFYVCFFLLLQNHGQEYIICVTQRWGARWRLCLWIDKRLRCLNTRRVAPRVAGFDVGGSFEGARAALVVTQHWKPEPPNSSRPLVHFICSFKIAAIKKYAVNGILLVCFCICFHHHPSGGEYKLWKCSVCAVESSLAVIHGKINLLCVAQVRRSAGTLKYAPNTWGSNFGERWSAFARHCGGFLGHAAASLAVVFVVWPGLVALSVHKIGGFRIWITSGCYLSVSLCIDFVCSKVAHQNVIYCGSLIDLRLVALAQSGHGLWISF